MKRERRLGATCACIATVLLLSACSGVKNYPEQKTQNLRIHTQVDSVSATRSTVAEFDVHLVDSHCETEYQGRVYLDQPLVETGIPTERMVYLDFIFASKTMLSSTVSGIRHGVLFTPRSGYEYDVKVSYDKGIYDVVLREMRDGTITRVIPRRSLDECRGSR